MREAEGRLVPAILEYGLQTWGSALLDEAWEEFFLWDNVPDNYEGSPEFETSFLPWFVFRFVPEPDEPFEPAEADAVSLDLPFDTSETDEDLNKEDLNEDDLDDDDLDDDDLDDDDLDEGDVDEDDVDEDEAAEDVPETGEALPDRPLGLAYLERHADELSGVERRFLEAACASPLSYYVVTAVEPGRSLTLRDVLTGREHRVLERSASSTLKPTSLLMTRVVSVDDVSIMVGCASLVIPPSYHNTIIVFRQDFAGARGTLTEDLVYDLDLDILGLYHEIADALRNPRLPTLTNTDGDPLAPTVLRYELRCSPREAFERLKPLALDPDEESLLAGATNDAAGRLQTVTLSWLKKGNKQHKHWENTVLGTLEIDGDRLTVHVNSERRASKIRREIARRLGKAAVLTESTTQSVEDVRKAVQAKKRAGLSEEDETALPVPTPEQEAALREMLERHWESWFHQKIPALGNLTPRQAARTPLGRERLEALLADYAWRAESQPRYLRPDIAVLRAKLGL